MIKLTPSQAHATRPGRVEVGAARAAAKVAAAREVAAMAAAARVAVEDG